MKERSRKEKVIVIKFWRSKGKHTVSDNDTSALLYDGKQVCSDFIVDSVTVSYLSRYDSLLQNVSDIITKCDSYFIAKCDSFITKCDSYYKMRRLLQIETIQ